MLTHQLLAPGAWVAEAGQGLRSRGTGWPRAGFSCPSRSHWRSPGLSRHLAPLLPGVSGHGGWKVSAAFKWERETRRGWVSSILCYSLDNTFLKCPTCLRAGQSRTDRKVRAAKGTDSMGGQRPRRPSCSSHRRTSAGPRQSQCTQQISLQVPEE